MDFNLKWSKTVLILVRLRLWQEGCVCIIEIMKLREIIANVREIWLQILTEMLTHRLILITLALEFIPHGQITLIICKWLLITVLRILSLSRDLGWFHMTRLVHCNKLIVVLCSKTCDSLIMGVPLVYSPLLLLLFLFLSYSSKEKILLIFLSQILLNETRYFCVAVFVLIRLAILLKFLKILLYPDLRIHHVNPKRV